MKIDSHHHFWRLDRYDAGWMTGGYEVLRRDFLPDDLAPHLRATGVDRTVFVQAQHEFEDNGWVLELSDDHDWLAGVVGWIDPTRDDFEEKLVELRRHPKFVGVRHLTHNEPDDDWIQRDDVLASLAVLEKHRVPFDLLFFVRHLHHAAPIARRFPELPLVIDHLAKPHIRDGRTDDWLPAFEAAAACANVHCKLSGMVTEADWTDWSPDGLRVYVQHALDLFGPERCMYGSDWPVCTVAATYQQQHDALVEALGPIGDSERDAIFGGTAARFYGLPPR